MNTQFPSEAEGNSQENINDEDLPVRDKLENFICNNPDLPTLGNSISSIVQLSSSDDQSIDQLTHLILADVSLTQKIIRLANTVTFRGNSNQIVTSISRAVQLLGLDTVKACALAMILVDRMPGKQSQFVRKELMNALTASSIGRELAKQSSFPNAEEVAIAALFKNMGRLLVAAFDAQLYKETMNVLKEGKSLTQASLITLGISFDAVTEMAMRQWCIPEVIIHAMKLMPAKTLKAPKNRQEWMKQVVEFSESAAQLVTDPKDSKAKSLPAELLSRFGNALDLNPNKLEALVSAVKEEVQAIGNQIDMQLSENSSDESEHSSDLNQVFYPSGKPHHACDLLFSGLQMLEGLASTPDVKINSVILMALETLHKGMGFNLAAVCLKDVKSDQFRARHFLGKYDSELENNFVFSENSHDVFSLAINKNADLFIADAKDVKVQNMLPEWHLKLLPATSSFLVLPLVVANKKLGLFYLDRLCKSEEGISSEEMHIIKEIKKQVLTTLQKIVTA
ncbi:MAG: HDOD domain-containing protein [Nitrosomonas sp.]|nr:HDOD domain-containing protein [Nitrosomonas sp.]